MNTDLFFCGWVRLSCDMSDAAAILELCMREHIAYRHWCNDAEGRHVSFEMSERTARIFLRKCSEAEIRVRTVLHGGLPHLLYRYRRRVGLLLGAFLGAAILIASTQVLWDIRVSGNETMTVRRVKEELRESGLYVGMPLARLNTAKEEMRIQLESECFSWVSINMSGTVAYVEVRERVPTPDGEPLSPANLIASAEGIVEGVEIYTGKSVVKAGQAVQKGELLVSGVYDSQAVGWRVTRAAGHVLARTEHEFEVEIPLVYQQKVYSGEHLQQKTLFFFEKEIKLLKNSRILGVSCDKISNINSAVLGKGVSLPFSLRTDRYLPYEYREAVRSYESAQALAYYELERQIAQALPDATLLRKTVAVTLAEDAYRLHCKVWCLEDIAQVQEFSVNE
ncbi:MAG: sporulation protein YqfD [Clostridia bacterium]|nr:sporulation protein YqfD [Clostridia bacterium]